MQVSPLGTALIGALTILPASKRDTLLTTLLLLDAGDPELRTHCLESVTRGSARIDGELVLSLYSAGDDEARLALACSVAISRMRPHAFRKIFDPVYARSDLTAKQRWNLAFSLGHFLEQNPHQRPAYEDILRDLARSPHFDVRVRGLQMAAQFARVDAELLALFKRRLKSRSPIIRLAAVAAFNLMVQRLDQLAPEIRGFIASDAFRDTATRLHRADPDEDVRWGASFVVRKLRKAFGPKRRR